MKEMPDAVILGFGNWDDLSDEERDRAIEYYRQQNEKGEDRNGN